MADHENGASTKPMRGRPVQFADGKVYIVPTLELGEYETLLSEIGKLPDLISLAKQSEMLALTCKVIHSALVHNYPDIKAEDLKKIMDLEALWPAWRAALNYPEPVPGAPAAAPKASAGEA